VSVPFRYDSYMYYSNTKFFNEMVKKRLSKSANIKFLNLDFLQRPDFTVHGLHLNGKGKQKLSVNIAKLLNTVSQAQETPNEDRLSKLPIASTPKNEPSKKLHPGDERVVSNNFDDLDSAQQSSQTLEGRSLAKQPFTDDMSNSNISNGSTDFSGTGTHSPWRGWEEKDIVEVRSSADSLKNHLTKLENSNNNGFQRTRYFLRKRHEFQVNS